jgi:hypothetical protein
LISVNTAISRFRRDLTIGSLLNVLLIAAAVGSLMTALLAGGGMGGSLLMLSVGALWIFLSYRSIKGSRLAADSPLLIASGRFDEAESRIDAALRSFSLFRTAKLLSLHHFALLRHAQRRWEESAQLCQALLAQRLGALQGLNKPNTLLLADNLMHLGDLPGVYQALCRLYRQRLNLSEALTMEQLQMEYLARIGAWDHMLANVGAKVQLAELMPSVQAARTQAYLALAALKSGRSTLSAWLRRRAELLVDPPDLTAGRPLLGELWP